MAFALGAGAVALSAGYAHDLSVWRTARPETLVFPLIAAPPAPPVRRVPPRVAALPVIKPTPAPPVATPVPTPAPTPTHTPAPPREYVTDVTQDVRINDKGLTAADFRAEARNPSLEYEVVRVDYVPDVQRRLRKNRKLSLVLLFDQSGSIGTSDPSNLRIQASQHLIDKMPLRARMAIAHFPTPDDSIPVQFDQLFSDDSFLVKKAIDGLAQNVGGGTPLFSSLAVTIDQLATEPESQQRIIICFTDGEPDTVNDTTDLNQVVASAKAAGIKIHFIALGNGNWTLLQYIATGTGGEVLAVSDNSNLEKAFETMAHKVSTVDKSFYRVQLRARRMGKPFAKREKLRGRIRVAGTRVPLFARAGS